MNNFYLFVLITTFLQLHQPFIYGIIITSLIIIQPNPCSFSIDPGIATCGVGVL